MKSTHLAAVGMVVDTAQCMHSTRLVRICTDTEDHLNLIYDVLA
jgi:hypothetical protein